MLKFGGLEKGGKIAKLAVTVISCQEKVIFRVRRGVVSSFCLTVCGENQASTFTISVVSEKIGSSQFTRDL